MTIYDIITKHLGTPKAEGEKVDIDLLVEELRGFMEKNSGTPSNPSKEEYTIKPFDIKTALMHPEWVWTKGGKKVDHLTEIGDKRLVGIAKGIGKLGIDGLRIWNLKGYFLFSDADFSGVEDHALSLVLRVPCKKVKKEGWTVVFPPRPKDEDRYGAWDVCLNKAEAERTLEEFREECEDEEYYLAHVEWEEEAL